MAAATDLDKRERQLRLMCQKHAPPACDIDGSRTRLASAAASNLGLDEDGCTVLHWQRVVEEEVVHGQCDAARQSQFFS